MKSRKNNRDDFPPKVRQTVALRASHHCSFPGCPQTTAGPSDESPMAVSMIGKAAHIHAAAPGGRRYLASMAPEERMDISNAIWLCATHADLIDRDDVSFSGDALRKMKREHEDRCAEKQRNAALAGDSIPDLIAVGPDIVFVGEFLAADDSGWSFRLQHFLEGDIHTLLSFAERYEQTAAIERYVLANFLGDGRALKAAPSVTKENAGAYVLRCPVFPRADRTAATELPRDFALSDAHDFMLDGGTIAEVSGIAALPQLVKTCLSHQRGESPFHRDFGTRFAEYYRLLRGSPWFGHILKLEIIRQAAILYNDRVMTRSYTPLKCVERVFGIEILADNPTMGWLPIRVDLDVKGIGRWQRELSVCIPEGPVTRPSFDELLAGPGAADQTSA